MKYLFACLFLASFVFITCTHAAQFTLTWSDNSTNESGFIIERAEGSGPFEPIADVPADIETYVDAGLPNSTEFSYRLFAYNDAGNSGYSNVATGTTPPPSPDTPGDLIVNPEPKYTPPVPVVRLTSGKSVVISADGVKP